MKTIDIHNLHYEMEADKVILSKDDFDELLESYTDIRSKLQEYQQLYNKVKKALTDLTSVSHDRITPFQSMRTSVDRSVMTSSSQHLECFPSSVFRFLHHKWRK